MYSFDINNLKIKSLELSVDSNIENAKFVEGDHNSCYGFKPYLKYIEFVDGNYIKNPNIEIFVPYIGRGHEPY